MRREQEGEFSLNLWDGQVGGPASESLVVDLIFIHHLSNKEKLYCVTILRFKCLKSKKGKSSGPCE